MDNVGSVRVAGRGGCAIRVENKARISSGDQSELVRELESKVLRSNLAKSIRPKELSGQIARIDDCENKRVRSSRSATTSKLSLRSAAFVACAIDHAGAAPARCHRAAIGIGRRCLVVGRGEQCLFNRGQSFHFFFEPRQLFPKPRLSAAPFPTALLLRRSGGRQCPVDSCSAQRSLRSAFGGAGPCLA